MQVRGDREGIVATTQWNVVLAARDGSESQGRLALEHFLSQKRDKA